MNQMNELCFVESMGLKVYSDHLKRIELCGSNKLLLTISPNSYGIATKDILFREALERADYLLLDGVYFGLAALLMQGKVIKRNQGPDVFRYFMSEMNKQGGRVFFIGSTKATLEKMRAAAARAYPNIMVGAYSPPFKPEFSTADNSAMIGHINGFKPDIVFVGMTAPKQEKWAYANRNEIDAQLTCCVGAVFDWFAGNEKEIAPIWWKLRLAWLIRTINRPEILKRYPSVGIFFWHLFLALVRVKRFESTPLRRTDR